MARFFTSPNDLAAWVKGLGAKKAATAIANLPKIGETNLMDIAETTRRIAEAGDSNAAETLFEMLKSAGVVGDDVAKAEEAVDHVQVADELLKRKVISADEHAQMVKQAQIMRQPGEYEMPLRLCPKLPWSVGKKLISTYNCRHYCLDGIVLDDDPARVYCGELLWRRHMMDKFSHEWQDRKTGEWVGGYVNERFYRFPDAGTPANPDVPRDGGNPMSLKPGERTRIPRPHQWSVERRMQEAREKGSGQDLKVGKTAAGWLGRAVTAQAQGVSEFIQSDELPVPPEMESQGFRPNEVCPTCHEKLEEHPDGEWLGEDKRGVGWTRLTSHCPKCSFSEQYDFSEKAEFRPVGKNPVQECGTAPVVAEADGKVVEAKKKGKPVNPWAVCHTTVDKDKNPEKYERCVMDVKAKHPVKKSDEEIAHEVLAAAGGMTKVSAEVADATTGEETVVKAFSMAIDLQASGMEASDAIMKIAEVTGLSAGKVVVIREEAIRKLAVHAGDAYTATDEELDRYIGGLTPAKPDPAVAGKANVPKKAPVANPDADVQQDAADLALTK